MLIRCVSTIITLRNASRTDMIFLHYSTKCVTNLCDSLHYSRNASRTDTIHPTHPSPHYLTNVVGTDAIPVTYLYDPPPLLDAMSYVLIQFPHLSTQ